ncbi:MAG: type II toxin-antitoxin system death-on-curing family toxin [Variovorax sp.]|nr:MAG: type II toxin-antitoxin system death-on-curing family toxin [Variovorax sp.]
MSVPPVKWVWLDGAVVHAVHEEQLAEHGGASGLRDANLLASALSRPEQLAHYESPDAAALAASYGYGIARNHPFTDGNKRTAFVAVELFLMLNGFELLANDAACVLTMLDLAAGKLEEQAFASWIREHLVSL